MKSQKNMDDKIFWCYLIEHSHLQSLYVEGLGLIISSRSKTKMRVTKIKSIEKLLTRFRRCGILRVNKSVCRIIGGRRFEVTHSMILELLDEQGYEVKN